MYMLFYRILQYLQPRWSDYSYRLTKLGYRVAHARACPVKYLSGDPRTMAICTRCLRFRYGRADVRATMEAINSQGDKHN